MSSPIPTPSQVRERLAAMSLADVRDLCKRTGAPFTTVWKIRAGETTDPKLGTVGLIWGHLPTQAANDPESQQAAKTLAAATQTMQRLQSSGGR